jgi:hypothetical protein
MFDGDGLKDVTIRLKSLADAFAADADRIEASDTISAASLRDLAEDVRREGTKLGLLSPIDIDGLKPENARMARELSCALPVSP